MENVVFTNHSSCRHAKGQSINMDWVVDLPDVYRNGALYNAVLTVMDLATNIVHLIHTNKNESSYDTAYLFLWNIVRLHCTDSHATSLQTVIRA